VVHATACYSAPAELCRASTMNLPRRQFLHLGAGAVALSAVSRVVRAQGYPSRPITLVVPFAPGGLADVIGRIVAEGMRPSIGQTVIIENVGGAGGNIGTGRVARAAPDGYTLVLGIWNTHVANGAIYSLQYDIVTDFEPVALLADAPLLLVANKAVPANDLSEFIAWLRANPDKTSMGTVGAGSPGHLLGILFQKQTGTRFGLVAYRGAGPMTQDVVAGQIEATFANSATSLPHVRAGSIKAFAVTAKNRLSAAPDIPSVDEAGLPGLHFSLWAGLFAPKGTPKDIISTLNATAVRTFDDPNTRQKLLEQGFVIPPREQQTPEALSDYQKAEIEKWWPIIKAAGIKEE
jgi:tripartite-type tricarboxylate transporter receptor subunit TctC